MPSSHLPPESHAVATHRGRVPGPDALLPVFWPGGGPCMPGRTHCLVEGPDLVVVRRFVSRHAAPCHIIRSFASKLPLLKNVYLLHFVVFVYLAVAIVLAVIVDHTRSAIRQLGESTEHGFEWACISGGGERFTRGVGALAALLVAVVAMAPTAAYLAKTIPMTVEAVSVPTWFRAVAPRLPGRPVVLALPAPFTTTTPGATWETKGGQRLPSGRGVETGGVDVACTHRATAIQLWEPVV